MPFPVPHKPQVSLQACLLARGPDDCHILQGWGPGPAHSRPCPRSGDCLLPTFPCEGTWLEAQLREGKGWAPAITDVQHNMLRAPRPTPGGGRKGESTCCPNIWTSQREPRCTIQMFSKLGAGCRQNADIWVEVDAYVRGERADLSRDSE